MTIIFASIELALTEAFIPIGAYLLFVGKTVISHSITFNHCRKNAAEIFQESGEFCLQERMMNKKMITLIGVAALMASIVTMNTQSTSLGIVQHAETSSALNEGYDTGRNDYLNGNMKDTYCDPDNSDPNPDAYCFQYKVGYEAGWAAARGLYGDQ